MSNTCRTQNSTFTARNIRACEKYVLNMQKRLDKAVANNDYKNIGSIFTILVRRPYAVKVLAVYRITYQNKGKYTAGVDNIALPKQSREDQNRFRHNLLNSRSNLLFQRQSAEQMRKATCPYFTLNAIVIYTLLLNINHLEIVSSIDSTMLY